jgi:hypothetical protein
MFVIYSAPLVCLLAWYFKWVCAKGFGPIQPQSEGNIQGKGSVLQWVLQ